jgi:hypothetical protein
VFSINGISLHDTVRDWTVLGSSEQTSGTAITRPSLTVPGLDGTFALPGTQDAPALAIMVGTPESGLAALRALLLQPSLKLGKAGVPGTATAELAALTPERIGAGQDPHYEVKILLGIPGIWYRGDVETSTAGIATATVELSTFPGISGKVRDALVRLTDVSNPKVTDAAGMFFQYAGTIPAGSWLRFHSDSGRAWLTETDTWEGGTEVDPLALTYGRGPGFFHITPSFTDPSLRAGVLTVTSTLYGPTAAIDVQGRNAYLV